MDGNDEIEKQERSKKIALFAMRLVGGVISSSFCGAIYLYFLVIAMVFVIFFQDFMKISVMGMFPALFGLDANGSAHYSASNIYSLPLMSLIIFAFPVAGWVGGKIFKLFHKHDASLLDELKILAVVLFFANIIAAASMIAVNFKHGAYAMEKAVFDFIAFVLVLSTIGAVVLVPYGIGRTLERLFASIEKIVENMGEGKQENPIDLAEIGSLQKKIREFS